MHGNGNGNGSAPLDNAKRERFAQEYLIDLNATQAAIRAGYAENSADVQGCRLLGDAKVAKRIAELQTKRAARVALTADWVLTELQGTYAAARIAGDHGPANKSLELLGKHLGMFVERHELTGKDGGPVEVSNVAEIRGRLADRLARFAITN